VLILKDDQKIEWAEDVDWDDATRMRKLFPDET